MRVGIIQSNYIPWMGYFEFIAQCDLFILLDCVQYTRRDWRNRNKIMTPRGEGWLTIPLKQSGNYHNRICDMEVSDPMWVKHHFDALHAAYRGAPFWNKYAEELEWAYLDSPSMLTGINSRFLALGCKWLEVPTPIRPDADFTSSGEKSQRLVALCKSAGATRYLSGPSAKSYLDERLFNDNGIAVDWMQYSDWPKLTFLHGLFNGIDTRALRKAA